LSVSERGDVQALHPPALGPPPFFHQVFPSHLAISVRSGFLTLKVYYLTRFRFLFSCFFPRDSSRGFESLGGGIQKWLPRSFPAHPFREPGVLDPVFFLPQFSQAEVTAVQPPCRRFSPDHNRRRLSRPVRPPYCSARCRTTRMACACGLPRCICRGFALKKIFPLGPMRPRGITTFDF